MKKIIALALLAGLAQAGQLTQTTAEVQQAVDNAIGIAILDGASTFTNSLTTTPTIIVPPTGYGMAFSGGSDFTASTNGTVTCNFDGKVYGLASGSISSSANSQTIEGHWYIDAVSQDIGFIRSIGSAGSSAYGSFAAPSGVLTVTNGATLSVYANTSGTTDLTFEDFCIHIQRVD